MDLASTAMNQGHAVVMAQKSHLYFDYCYNRTPASLVYGFEPIPPGLPDGQRCLVLGLQACMWTHLARTTEAIDMSIFPRVLALAEVGWTPVNRRNWEEFAARMARHEPLLESRGVHCFRRNEGPGLPSLGTGQDGRIWLVNRAGRIFSGKDGTWTPFPGAARQATSTPDGRVWCLAAAAGPRGYPLLRWTGSEWAALGDEVAAVQISAAPDGSVWAVTNSYAIYRYAEGRWANVLGLAREVAVDAGNTAWILTPNPAPGGFELFSSPPGGRWRRVLPMQAALHLSAGPAGQVLLARADGTLWGRAGETWEPRPGRLSQFAVARTGETWGVTADAHGVLHVVRWSDREWKEAGPVP
jgi:hypothetical protein